MVNPGNKQLDEQLRKIVAAAYELHPNDVTKFWQEIHKQVMAIAHEGERDHMLDYLACCQCRQLAWDYRLFVNETLKRCAANGTITNAVVNKCTPNLPYPVARPKVRKMTDGLNAAQAAAWGSLYGNRHVHFDGKIMLMGEMRRADIDMWMACEIANAESVRKNKDFAVAIGAWAKDHIKGDRQVRTIPAQKFDLAYERLYKDVYGTAPRIESA